MLFDVVYQHLSIPCLRVNRRLIVWLAARRQGRFALLPFDFHLDDARFAKDRWRLRFHAGSVTSLMKSACFRWARTVCMLNAVRQKWDYLHELKLAIENKHKCSALYLRTQMVELTIRGKILWIGDVEIFAIARHRKAKRCYAWKHCEGRKAQGEQFVAVLGIEPVDSPEAAVRTRIGSDSNDG